MTAPARRPSVPGEQRVFSLVLALVASPEGATKRELLSSVYGYSDRYRVGERSEALERQFERDKDQLRRLGIPIDTIDAPLEPGNTQLTRYRISKERLQIPSDLRFTEEEIALLRMAALAWREGSLTEESRRAMMKLEALGAGLDIRRLGVAPRIGIPEPAAPALQRAIDEGRAVRFEYRLPTRSAALERHVAPLRLHRADERWHLIAWDLEREANRVFLLARIEGAVRIEKETVDPDLHSGVDGVVEELLRRQRHQVARVNVRRGSVAEARLAPRAAEGSRSLDAGGPDDARELRIGTLDYHEFALAEELVGYGEDVAVIEPEELRDAVVERLRAVAAEHGAVTRGGEPRGGGAHA